MMFFVAGTGRFSNAGSWAVCAVRIRYQMSVTAVLLLVASWWNVIDVFLGAIDILRGNVIAVLLL